MDGAPQQTDPTAGGSWFDSVQPPPGGDPRAMVPPTTSASAPAFTAGMTDDQFAQTLTSYYQQYGKTPTASDIQSWHQYWNQFGNGDPAYFTSRLTQGLSSPPGMGGGQYAQGGPFPAFQPPSYEDFLKSPGLQFGLDQGLKAVNTNAASRGLLQTGGTLKGLTDYATNYGLTKYNDVFNQGLATNQQNFGINQGNFGNLYNLGNWGFNAANGATA